MATIFSLDPFFILDWISNMRSHNAPQNCPIISRFDSSFLINQNWSIFPLFDYRLISCWWMRSSRTTGWIMSPGWWPRIPRTWSIFSAPNISSWGVTDHFLTTTGISSPLWWVERCFFSSPHLIRRNGGNFFSSSFLLIRRYDNTIWERLVEKHFSYRLEDFYPVFFFFFQKEGRVWVILVNLREWLV